MTINWPEIWWNITQAGGNGWKYPLLPENVEKRSLNYLGTLERVTTAFKKCLFSGIFVLNIFWTLKLSIQLILGHYKSTCLPFLTPRPDMGEHLPDILAPAQGNLNCPAIANVSNIGKCSIRHRHNISVAICNSSGDINKIIFIILITMF